MPSTWGAGAVLNPEGLLQVLAIAREAGVWIEYVETNSSWYRDQDSAVALLRELKDRGLGALLISISPFHNGHIPFQQVKGVIEACRVTGLAAFPGSPTSTRSWTPLIPALPTGWGSMRRDSGRIT